MKSDEPSAAGELRRSLGPYNLMMGALPALVVAGLMAATTLAGVTPDVLGAGARLQAVVIGLALFVTITAFHAAAHTYFGWRFARGLRAARAGDHRRALRLLEPVTRPGMNHYDPAGQARRMLEASRSVLVTSGSGASSDRTTVAAADARAGARSPSPAPTDRAR